MIPPATRANVLPYEKWPRAKSPPLNLESYTQGSISRIESGVAEDVYASTVLSFAKALQVSTDSLLGVAPLEQAPSQSKQPTATRPRPHKAAPVA